MTPSSSAPKSLILSLPADDLALFGEASAREDSDAATALVRYVRDVANAERARRRRVSLTAYNDRADRPQLDSGEVLRDLRETRDAS